MKKKIPLTIATFVLVLMNNIVAQDIWAAAISSTGMLLGNYKITELLSEEMKNQLKNLEVGTKLYFEGIIATYPNNETRAVVVLSFI